MRKRRVCGSGSVKPAKSSGLEAWSCRRARSDQAFLKEQVTTPGVRTAACGSWPLCAGCQGESSAQVKARLSGSPKVQRPRVVDAGPFAPPLAALPALDPPELALLPAEGTPGLVVAMVWSPDWSDQL